MIRNSFCVGPEGWHSYDYHGEIVTGAGIFVLTTWQKEGGVNGGGCIWADQSRWSTDVPERPISILALIHYRNWVGLDPIDLRGCEASVYLRGDNLRLYGAECYFWVHAPGVRWHFRETRSQSRKKSGRLVRAGFAWRTMKRCGIAVTAARSSGTAVILKAGRDSTVYWEMPTATAFRLSDSAVRSKADFRWRSSRFFLHDREAWTGTGGRNERANKPQRRPN